MLSFCRSSRPKGDGPRGAEEEGSAELRLLLDDDPKNDGFHRELGVCCGGCCCWYERGIVEEKLLTANGCRYWPLLLLLASNVPGGGVYLNAVTDNRTPLENVCGKYDVGASGLTVAGCGSAGCAVGLWSVRQSRASYTPSGAENESSLPPQALQWALPVRGTSVLVESMLDWFSLRTLLNIVPDE